MILGGRMKTRIANRDTVYRDTAYRNTAWPPAQCDTLPVRISPRSLRPLKFSILFAPAPDQRGKKYSQVEFAHHQTCCRVAVPTVS